MNPVVFIREKREGKKHRREDLEAFLLGYLRDEVPDYQVAAWLMAAFLRGLDAEETLWLTETMARSGKVLDLSGLPHPVDKHSSGGVGDKVSLVVGPILAASGCTFAKMSGRGLAHTGGTIDKLESVPGWRGEMTEAEFLERARRVGLVIAAQSPDLAPLDGKLYALRDVTATVESVPLIASSIMSKKLAAGARSIVLDVKVGRGAFMKTLEEARLLAKTMVAIGQGAGRRVRALLTSMEAPLGRAVGNAIEVREAIGALKGEGPEDLLEVALALAEEALKLEGLDPALARKAGRPWRSSGPSSRPRGETPGRWRTSPFCPSPRSTPSVPSGRAWCRRWTPTRWASPSSPWAGGGSGRGSPLTTGWGSTCSRSPGTGWSGGRPWPWSTTGGGAWRRPLGTCARPTPWGRKRTPPPCSWRPSRYPTRSRNQGVNPESGSPGPNRGRTAPTPGAGAWPPGGMVYFRG